MLESISSFNTKYDNIQVTLSQLEKDKTALVEEIASLRTQILSITNDLKQAKMPLNDLENSIPEETALKFVAIPLPEEPSEEDTNVACENIRFSSLVAPGDVSRGGTSATQRQKFHTDDVKSVRNPVRRADWSTE